MKKKLALTLTLTVTTALLAGCSGGGNSADARVVNVCGWGENIEPELIDQFEEETGIKVNYQTAESNEAMYALIKNGGANYDVIVPSDYMILPDDRRGYASRTQFRQHPQLLSRG